VVDLDGDDSLDILFGSYDDNLYCKLLLLKILSKLTTISEAVNKEGFKV
jgi:hypothetical protein